MKEEKILTLHPQGKSGVNILKTRYDFIAAYILETIRREGELTYTSLNERAVSELSEKFDGSIPWYIVTVKLDLEARQIIERIPKTSPHKIRLKQ